MAQDKKLLIVFVIQGKEYPVEVNIKEAIKAAVHKVLKQAGQQGTHEGWELRKEDGKIIDMNASFEDQGITVPTKLFLSKGAGRGGK